MTTLIDSFGRKIVNLRISVTDRCNLRCSYCIPTEDVEWLPREGVLSFEEIERFVRVVAPLGIRKLRLTGGEPLLRKDLPDLVARLTAVPGIEDVGMTTNAVRPGAQGPVVAGRRAPAVERVAGHGGPRALRAAHPARQPAGRPGRAGRGRRGGVRAGEDQRRHRAPQEPGRGGAAGEAGARTRLRPALHRVHADRHGRRLAEGRRGPQRRDPGAAAGDRARWNPSANPTAPARPSAGAGRTARGRSASSAA